MPRIFVAIPLSPAAAAALASVVPDLPSLRRVGADLLHVTLAFVGRIPEERVGEVIDACALAAVSEPAFRIALDALGTFPEGGRARVVWAGTGPAERRIEHLGAAVRSALDRRAIPFDLRPLRPHVTVGRVRESATRAEAAAIARAVRSIAPPPVSSPADAIHVMESVLSPRGARYSSRARIPLTRGTGR